MSVKIGINGFGRIGRNIFRALSEDEAFADIEVVGINDLTDNKTIAHLLKYDSVMGVSRADIKSSDTGISVDGREIPVTSHRNPADISWKEMGAEYVLECTGLFRDLETAGAHIDAGASKVIISAPAKGGVKTFVMGVNEDEYDPTEHHIVSNASCTTNCLAPVAQVILRRARAAAMSMIPTKTGAASAVALVIPELKNKFDGLAVRVPTPDVSLVDVVMEVERETTVTEVNKALQEADGRFLRYCDEPLVSIDFQGDPHSSIVDGLCTKVLGTTVKVMSWYDNEWGYSNRMLDLVLHMEANKPL